MSCNLPHEIEDALARIRFSAMGLRGLLNSVRRVRDRGAETPSKALLRRKHAWLSIRAVAGSLEDVINHVEDGGGGK